MTRKRIGWLDSTGAPSHIHATDDEGESTVCDNHRPKDRMRVANAPCPGVEPRNVISRVPQRILGRSRYCKTCFENGGHSLPWVTPPGPEDFLENGLLRHAEKFPDAVEIARPLPGESAQPIRTPDHQEWLDLREGAESLADETDLVGLAASVENPEDLRDALKTVIARCARMLAHLEPGHAREAAPSAEEKKS